jgi:flagellar capping protein FliD
MDAGTMKDYIDDLILKVNTLEGQFRTLEEIIKQLQIQRDMYKLLYDDLNVEYRKLVDKITND